MGIDAIRTAPNTLLYAKADAKQYAQTQIAGQLILFLDPSAWTR